MSITRSQPLLHNTTESFKMASSTRCICLRGSRRPLLHGDEKDADKSVLVYSWRSEVDYVWPGSRFDGKPVVKTPPPNRVFVVLVREERQPNEFPGVGAVFGSIEKWNWVKEDPALPHAPI